MARASLRARLAALLALALAPAPLAAPAGAQQLKKGQVSGTILSFSATGPPAAFTSIATLPATGRFVLMQICANDGPATVAGDTVGTIYVSNGNGDGCTRFHPGIALPPGEDMGFTNGAAVGVTVVLNGVLSKK